jgi:hypothetical protein
VPLEAFTSSSCAAPATLCNPQQLGMSQHLQVYMVFAQAVGATRLHRSAAMPQMVCSSMINCCGWYYFCYSFFAENFPGFPEPILGGDLCDRFRCAQHSWQGCSSSGRCSTSSSSRCSSSSSRCSHRSGCSGQSCTLRAMKQWHCLCRGSASA